MFPSLYGIKSLTTAQYMSKADRIAQLIFQYSSDELSEQERQELKQWIDGSEKNRLEFERLTDAEGMKHFLDFRDSMEFGSQKRNFNSKTIFLTHTWKRYVAAASVLFMIALGIYLRYNNTTRDIIPNTAQQQAIISDVSPGNYEALLKLSDGKEIVLNNAGAGLLAKQGNASIYNENGQVKYNTVGAESKEVLYNILETATGQTYALTLSDGTKVWLNSKSSLKFPAEFSRSERRVEMQGEVFFDVAPLSPKGGQSKTPFIVKINTPSGDGAEVVVLGTEFNINAYPDEPGMRTTLLEGKVQLSATIDHKPQTIKLLPGQQARFNDAGAIQVINNVNTDAVTAWKNEIFYFQSYDLKTIMRQLSRWYGIDVVYEKSIPPGLTLSGMVSRNRNLSDVLKALELNDVHFRVEGKKLIVIP